MIVAKLAEESDCKLSSLEDKVCDRDEKRAGCFRTKGKVLRLSVPTSWVPVSFQQYMIYL